MEKNLKVTLWKEKIQNHQSQEKRTPNIPTIEPQIHKITRAIKTENTTSRVKINKLTKKSNNLTIVKPIQTKDEMLNALDISKLIKNHKPLQEVDLDFQARNDKFIYNNLIKPKQEKLIVTNKIAQSINVKNPDSLLVASTKKAISFLFTPINEADKTQDSIPYCALYGRRTFFCPRKSF